jgi:hypothetical protein
MSLSKSIVNLVYLDGPGYTALPLKTARFLLIAAGSSLLLACQSGSDFTYLQRFYETLHSDASISDISAWQLAARNARSNCRSLLR